MSDQSTFQIWAMRALFLGICGCVLAYHLLPIAPLSHIIMPPDLILGFSLAWTVRRPEYAPIWLIAFVALLADLLLMRVPGLWAAMTVIAVGYVHRRRGLMQNTGFGVEWAQVGLAIAAAFILFRLAFAILLLEPQPTAGMFTQFATTLAIYPLLVLVTTWIFRVRKPVLAEGAGYRT